MQLRFKKQAEKEQSWLYKEISPGKIIGGFYLSKIAVFYEFDDKPPEELVMTLERANDLK